MTSADWLCSSKFKVARGGGRHFSRDLDPRKVIKNEEESTEEESSEEEDDDDDDETPGRVDPASAGLSKEMAAMNVKLGNTEEVVGEEMSRAERKAMKKTQAEAQTKKTVTIKEDENESEEDDEEEDEDELLNPRKATEKRQAEKAKAKTAAPAEMSRKER